MSKNGEHNEGDGKTEYDLPIDNHHNKSKNHLNYDNILDHIGQLGR